METQSGPQFWQRWLTALLLELVRRDACRRQVASAFGLNHQLCHPGLASNVSD